MQEASKGACLPPSPGPWLCPSCSRLARDLCRPFPLTGCYCMCPCCSRSSGVVAWLASPAWRPPSYCQSTRSTPAPHRRASSSRAGSAAPPVPGLWVPAACVGGTRASGAGGCLVGGRHISGSGIQPAGNARHGRCGAASGAGVQGRCRAAGGLVGGAGWACGGGQARRCTPRRRGCWGWWGCCGHRLWCRQRRCGLWCCCWRRRGKWGEGQP